MASIDLRSYDAICTANLIKWIIPNFDTALLTDFRYPVTLNDEEYINIGNLLNISGATSELKASANQISITLSGIPTGSISDILNQEIKGSEIYIIRAFFNPITYDYIDIDPGVGENGVQLVFKGIVTNYDISDDVDALAKTATSSIVLTCASVVEVLTNKVSGRRTNNADFPGESSMSRVQALSNSNFNFGAP